MTVSDEPCEVHQMSWCAECAPKPPTPVLRDVGPEVFAQHGGRCACCDEGYPEGTLIAFSEADSGWAIAIHLKPLVAGGIDFSDLL